MTQVTDIGSGVVRLSISQIASEFGMARETVSKYLQNTGVKPSGARVGYPTYRLADVIGVLTAASGGDGVMDPDKLRPTDRRAWYQSENERLNYQEQCGNLVLATQVRFEMAMMAKQVVHFLETLPDTTERDLRCGPEVVEYLHKRIREIRTQLAAAIANEDADAA